MDLNSGEADPPQRRPNRLRVASGIGEHRGVFVSRIANYERDTSPVVGAGAPCPRQSGQQTQPTRAPT